MANRRDMEIWRPARDLSRLQRGVERLFVDMLTPFGDPALSQSLPALSSPMDLWNPAVEVEEQDDKYALSLDLPGIRPEDVKIEVQDNQLIVSGERKDERTEERKSRHHMTERFYGAFYRTFALPTSIKVEDVEASFQDGVLKIAIPKVAAAQPRQVKIMQHQPQRAPDKSKEKAA